MMNCNKCGKDLYGDSKENVYFRHNGKVYCSFCVKELVCLILDVGGGGWNTGGYLSDQKMIQLVGAYSPLWSDDLRNLLDILEHDPLKLFCI